MHVRTPTGSPVPPTSPQPLPVPPRWHLRTQVSRKTLFDLIQDTLPPAGLHASSGPDGVAMASDLLAGEGASGRVPAAAGGPGVLPQSYLDTLAATIPTPLHPAALWNDGDTTPDIPEHWRPITITLASTPPPALPPPAPRLPLHGAIKTAGWMLSGAALTFLISAAAFGGRPMLRAIRAVMVPHAETTPGGPSPARQTAPAPLPARAPAPQPGRALSTGPTVVAIAERPEAQLRPVTAPPSMGADRTLPAGKDEGDSGLDGDHKNGAASAHASHRGRQDRRLAKSATLTESGRADASLLDADDAVMPLASAVADAHGDSWAAARAPAPAKPAAVVKAPAVTRSPAIAKTISSRVFRPIDVEDPFGGR